MVAGGNGAHWVAAVKAAEAGRKLDIVHVAILGLKEEETIVLGYLMNPKLVTTLFVLVIAYSQIFFKKFLMKG